MKKRIGLVLLIVLLTMLVIYLGISYAVYDKLSRVTAGGGDNARNTPASFVMTYAEWPSFDERPYFMPDYEAVRIPSRQAGLSLAGWYVPGKVLGQNRCGT